MRTTTPMKRLVIVLAACSIGYAWQPALAAAPDAIDEIVRAEMADQHIPGVSVAVVRKGAIVKVGGYGLANVEHDVPATPETVYQIQSITKTFTATAIMMLVEEGKIDVNAKVGAHLPGTPASWKDIEIRHLLSHTSGIPDFINSPTASLRLDATEQEVFDSVVVRPLDFQPGEKYAYSNTNFHLLAMMIRRLTGKSYGDFLAERIFKPLGMEHTAIISWSEIIPHRAAGYRRINGELRNGEYIAASILGYGGGGMRSTVLDMAKWDAALYTDKLVKQASLERMWTPAKLNDGKSTEYGFGWAVTRINGHRCASHTGAHVTGFTTAIQRFLDDDLTVIVLTNRQGANPRRIGQRVAAHYVPELAVASSKPAK